MRGELVYVLLGGFVLSVLPVSAAHAELVGQWKFDEGAGTIAADASGNGNNGTLQGGPTFVDGRFGSALSFANSRVAIPASDSSTADLFQGPFTLSAWINPKRTGSTWQQVFRSVKANGESSDTLFISNDGRLSWRGRLGGTWTTLCETSAGVVPANQWTHAAVTGDGTNFRIYVNAALSKESAFRKTDGTNATYYIGGDPKFPGESYAGIIDDVRVYDHAMNQEDISLAMRTQDVVMPKAYAPNPADGAIHLETWATLSWMPGSAADSHDVYFGESFTDVRDGTGDTFQGNQRSTSFSVGVPGSPYPDGLAPDTTYYWRVDEVEADGATKHRGSVWSFFVSTAKAHHPVPRDGAQLVAANVALSWEAGSGAKLHTVYFGDDFDDVNNAAGGSGQVATIYSPGPLEFAKTYYWRVDESEGGRGGETHSSDVWSFTTRPAELSSAVFYYVDADSPDASDINPGTEEWPWKTIRRGVQSLQPGDVLLIKGGTYREEVILQRSGTQSQPIRIWAYPGHEGKVIINAAEPVTNWHRCTGPQECAGNPNWGRIYWADVTALVQSHPDSGFAVRQVFQHGQLLNRSRHPDVGWSYPTSVADPTRTFTDSSLSKPDGYFAGSVCHIKTADWQIDQIPVSSFAKATITLSQNPRLAMTTRYGYYITSIVGEINAEGEWAYDPAQKRIFLWPQGDVPEGVEFSYRQNCLQSNSGTVWNVVRGLTMRYAHRCGIWLNRSHHMRIEDNTIEYAYFDGLYVYAGAGATGDYNQIVHNTIRYSAGYSLSVDIACSYTNVEGNYVYAAGTDTFGGDLMNGPSWGIYVSGPYTRVFNNRIDRTGYSALYVDGKTLGREISYNYVTNAGLALADGGGIYTGGYSNVPEMDHIHHNIFADSIGCRSMDRNFDNGQTPTPSTHSGIMHGIYVDERGNNRLIEYNTVINCRSNGIMFHWAPGNIVQKNTLYGNWKNQVYFNGDNNDRQRLIDDVLLDNILFSTTPQQYTLWVGMNYDGIRFGQSDRNYFYHPYNDTPIYVSYISDSESRRISDDLTLYEWHLLSGYDGNSKDFAYLEQLNTVDLVYPRASRIVYNATLDVVTIDLEGNTYCDVEGNKIFGSVTLQPFESKILITCDF